MAEYNFEIGLEFAPTGVISTTSGSPTVTGTGTQFTTEFAPGYLLKVGSVWRVVSVVNSNTNITLTANATTYAGGYSGVNLRNVEDLGVLPPKPQFRIWSKSIPLGSGLVRGAGRPNTAWQWGYLELAQRQALRAYCSGKSANVFVRTQTLDNNDAYRYYSGVVSWPDDERREASRRLEFTLQFNYLVEVPQ